MKEQPKYRGTKIRNIRVSDGEWEKFIQNKSTYLSWETFIRMTNDLYDFIKKEYPDQLK